LHWFRHVASPDGARCTGMDAKDGRDASPGE
jgi:hypothetical protein